MTRWAQEFEQSAFKRSWTSLLEQAELLTIDDQTVVPTLQEVARLKKALTFIAGIIATVDFELTPKSVWDVCVAQSDACAAQLRQYESNRSANHLIAANDHVDNLLNYVRPYMVYPQDTLTAHSSAVHKFSLTLDQYLEAFRNHAATTAKALADTLDHASRQRHDLDALETQIKEFHTFLFDETGESEGSARAVKQRIKDINAQTADVQLLHDQLLKGPESTSAVIKATEKKAAETHEALSRMQDSAAKSHETLDKFYDRIFGTPSTDDPLRREGGLDQELHNRMTELDSFELSQHTRHDALFKKIEDLLPGATSASLAGAYKELKDKFATPIENYTRVFYASLALLLVCGLIVVTDSISLWPPSIQFVKGADWIETLRTLLTRIPIIVPIVWVAIFSATRRSQYERLQQEYSHKEALATSYDSFKKQLKDLGGDTDELQKALIAKAIDAIAYNASTTLDGKHTEKLPAMQFLEKLSADELKKLWDLARGK